MSALDQKYVTLRYVAADYILQHYKSLPQKQIYIDKLSHDSADSIRSLVKYMK